jgi:dihydrodipicolinate synthase/N-acetylneuraminate lyase
MKTPFDRQSLSRNDQTRRGFLKGVGGLGVLLGAQPLWLYGGSHSHLSPLEVKAKIRGPILTLPTPFTADFKVDDQGVRNLVKLGLANGIGVFELTMGNSMYGCLTYDEIKKLTRVFVEAVGGRGIVIAATGQWWTGQAVDYARYAESVGADAVQVLLPNGGSDDGYVEHFQKIAAATKIAIVLQGDPKPALIERFVQIPSVVSMKEDGTEEYYAEIQKKFGQRLAIFCGGQKRRYLVGLPFGSPAYFSFFITFAPEIAVRFYQAVQKNDLVTARDIVEKYEKPVFDFCGAGPRGFHAYWRALMEHAGVTKRFVRPPEDSCNEEDMRRVRELFERLGLKPLKR